MARRKRFTAKDRARIFAAHNGICHLCGGKIKDNEAWELEHIIAWALTQDDSDENLAPAHVKCHKAKTHKQDRPAINKPSASTTNAGVLQPRRRRSRAEASTILRSSRS